VKAVREFRGYIEANQSSILNHGDRYRHGEAISTAFAKSTVDQVVSERMVRRQQMHWEEVKAHHLLRMRTKALNHELRATFARCYPGMRTDQGANIEGCAASGLKCSPFPTEHSGTDPTKQCGALQSYLPFLTEYVIPRLRFKFEKSCAGRKR
jgi:hypothetical protein